VASPTVLAGIDRAAFAVALATRLRERGVPVGVAAFETFVRALSATPPVSRSVLYWTARVSLIRRHAEIEVFDAVFAAIFDNAVLEMDPNARRVPLPNLPGAQRNRAVAGDATGSGGSGGLPWAVLPAMAADPDAAEFTLAVLERLPTALAGLVDTPFDDLDAGQLAMLGQWLQVAVRTWSTRRSRRFAIDRNGHRIAIRPTIARARHTAWEPIELARVEPARRPRRVVMLCDVSQSMQAQATAYFHLMRVLTLRRDAELFAFATTLTRLTAVLSHRSPQVAIDAATAKVVDRFGGTRIATNLQALLSSHHGNAVRGAIVVVASDGWDGDPPDQLAAAMARLRRRAHRIVWINPRAAAPGYAPLVPTMAAALPYCDYLLPADTFASLARVVTELGAASRRRSRSMPSGRRR